MTGQLRKGDRLRQDDIAEELGVSRIPVREAIIALDREGWLSFEANRGAFVTGLEANDVRDHYGLRGLVLGLAAKRATEMASAEEMADLSSRFQAMRRSDDLATFSSLNERFLAKLLNLSDSPRLRAALLVTPSIIPRGFFDVVPTGREIQEQGIGRLVRLMKARKADEVDQAMRAILGRQGEAVIAAFAASGLIGSSPS